MELRQLKYFAAVQEHRSFTRAAQDLHVTQPTVTTALRNLEEELGTPLIDRFGQEWYDELVANCELYIQQYLTEQNNTFN